MLYAFFSLAAPDQHSVLDAFYKYKNLCNCLDKAGRDLKKKKKGLGGGRKRTGVGYTVQESPELLQKLK